MSQNLRVAVNFVQVYYKMMLTNPEELQPLYMPTAQISRTGSAASSQRSASYISNQLRAIPRYNHRVAVSKIDLVEGNDKPLCFTFVVTGKLVPLGHEDTHYFKHFFELKSHGDKTKGYSIYSDAWSKDEEAEEHANAPEAHQPPPPSMTSWSAETPPMFSKKATPEQMPPPLDVAAEEPKAVAAPAPVVVAAPVVAAPAKKVEEPKTTPLVAPTAAVEEPKAAEPVKEVKPVKEEKPKAAAAPTKPVVFANFADRLRGKAGHADPVAAPVAAKAEAPAAVEEEEKVAEPVKEVKKEKAAEKKKAEPKAKATTPRKEEKPVAAAKPAAAAVEEVAEPTPAAAEPVVEEAVEEKPKGPPVNAWKCGPLNTAAAAAKPTSATKPVVVTAVTAASAAATAAAAEKVKAAERPAGEKKERKPLSADKQGGLSNVVSHYHVFVKNLPEGTTEAQLTELMSKHVPVKGGMKIDRKPAQDTRGGGGEPKIRTFAFVCLDSKNVSKEVAILKKERISLKNHVIQFDEVRDKSVFAAPGSRARRE